MTGEPGTSKGSGTTKAEHTVGLDRLYSALEKLHLAEAEVARVRADLAKKGITFESGSDAHW